MEHETIASNIFQSTAAAGDYGDSLPRMSYLSGTNEATARDEKGNQVITTYDQKFAIYHILHTLVYWT